MTQLAYGAKQVHALQVALGGEPPKEAAEESRAALERHVREHFERAYTSRASVAPLLQRAQAPVLEILRNDVGAIKAVEDLRKHVRARANKKRSAHRKRIQVEPRFNSGSQFAVRALPYDSPLMLQGGSATSTANIVEGTYSIAVDGNGSSAWASAGVGMWIFCTEENPSQRIAAMVEYDYQWSDTSVAGYIAHNDGFTNIWVWGAHEHAWVLQQGGLFPSWSDGTGWYDSHGSGGEQSGFETLEAFFPSLANSWYFAWIWTGGSCDDNSGSIVGFSHAQQSQSMVVPFVVLGSL
jgi:hypothetical protein